MALHTIQSKYKCWPVNQVFNQGLTGACIPFSWAHILVAAPHSKDFLDDPFIIKKIYWKAQKIDRWEGGEYPKASFLRFGTSVAASAKVITSLKLVEGVQFITSFDDLCKAVLKNGPVLFGVPWHTSMHTPNSAGFVEVSGLSYGRHCVTIMGIKIVSKKNDIDKKRSYFLFLNTKGPDWGSAGKAKISFSDVEKLFPNSEVCIPIKN